MDTLGKYATECTIAKQKSDAHWKERKGNFRLSLHGLLCSDTWTILVR